MSKLKIVIAILCINILTPHFMYSQMGEGNTCVKAEPLCGSREFYYPNNSEFSHAESGPNYGCVKAQLNPSWFYLQIAKDGDIQLMIEQSITVDGPPNLDVDYIIYGPFNDAISGCASDLTSENTVDCSYAAAYVEFVDMANTKAGEYYLLLITNFSLHSGFIRVTQTAGAATTNCVLLNDPILIEEVGCDGDLLSLNATTTNGVFYKWYEENGIGTGNYTVIDGATNATFDVLLSNNYSAEVFDINNVLIEKYQFNVSYNQKPSVPENIELYAICDNFETVDGIGLFDLSTKDSEILNGLNPTNFSVTYFNNESDALTGVNQLPIMYHNSRSSEVLFTRIDNNLSNTVTCFDIGFFDIKVNVFPEFELKDAYILCVNTNGTEELVSPIIDTGFDSLNYSFVWKLNGEILNDEVEGAIEPTEEGIYSVAVTNIATGCSFENFTVVNASSPPTISAAVISNAFSDNNTVEVTAYGVGEQNYEYSIDNELWQDSNVFKDLILGEHTITVRDIIGCGQTNTLITVMDYPLYFTPNGDGFHDTWNITGLEQQLQAKIFIFNRFGKVITQLTPTSMGWDGTFNGQQLPSTDYWFTVEYMEPRENKLKLFKAHFTLKR